MAEGAAKGAVTRVPKERPLLTISGRNFGPNVGRRKTCQDVL